VPFAILLYILYNSFFMDLPVQTIHIANGSHYMSTTKLTLFIVSKNELDTKEAAIFIVTTLIAEVLFKKLLICAVV